MHAVALAATDGMLSFELTIASEVFGDDPRYDFAVCGSGPVRVGRFLLEPDHGLDRLARAGTLIVPGWADVDSDPPADLLQPAPTRPPRPPPAAAAGPGHPPPAPPGGGGGGPGPGGRPCPPSPCPATSARRRAPRRCSGCSSSASDGRRSSWRTRTPAWTRSP